MAQESGGRNSTAELTGLAWSEPEQADNEWYEAINWLGTGAVKSGIP